MKKAAPVPSREGRVTGEEPRASGHPPRVLNHTKAAFTLIELMVVIGIMAVILAMGAPSIVRILRKEGMRKATADIVEICSKARARAILGGTPMDVVFHPLERRLEVGGASGGGGAPQSEGEGGPVEERPALPSSSDSSAVIPEDIIIEMLDINLSEYKDSEWARVRFYPNGTSDEMTVVLHSDRNEWRKITLELTTGLASVDDVR